MFNCVIAGVGGQGTVLASKLIAAAAGKKGFDVRTTETIGMAQRGGSVVSHIRIGKDIGEIFSPIIPLGEAHAIVAFEPSEAVRQTAFLRKDGRVAVCGTAVMPAGAPAGSYDGEEMLAFLRKTVGGLTVIDGGEIMRRCAKALNVAVLGAAAECGIFPFDAETLLEALPEVVPAKFIELNLTALELGRRAAG
jgi:indolepyruvate ferredoxin oxidoreductase beta subunit